MSAYSQYLQGKAIQTGCEWRLKIKITSSALQAFPPTARFVAHVRPSVDGPLLATMSTDLRNIARVDNNTIELVLWDSQTAHWTEGKVVIDIVRVDLTQKVHLGFDLEIPVKRTITRV